MRLAKTGHLNWCRASTKAAFATCSSYRSALNLKDFTKGQELDVNMIFYFYIKCQCRSSVQINYDADNVKPAGLHNVEAQVVVSLVFGPAEDDFGLGLADLQVPIVLRVLFNTRQQRDKMKRGKESKNKNRL